MTDKERLEQVYVVHHEEDEDGNHFVLIKEDDYYFLEEQAEKVDELEGNESQISKLKRLIGRNLKPEIDRLHKENKRLSEALEFYADEMKYEYEITQDEQREVECEIMDDFGALARKTLEELK